MIFYAHSKKDHDEKDWQLLLNHLIQVAKMAADFAFPFGGSSWAYFCGLLHDLGKYSKEFQKRLRGGKKVDHTLAGAVEIIRLAESLKKSMAVSRLIAHNISGHHTGLVDGTSNLTGAPSMKERLGKAATLPDYIAWKNEVSLPEWPGMPSLPPPLPHTSRSELAPLLSMPFFVWGKMLYSCLVDADFLDTEAFMNPDKSDLRGNYPVLSDLHDQLDIYLNEKTKEADKNLLINQYRAGVLSDCRAAGNKDQGIFSLTVPTGGGKTLSSLAFAMEHAKKHNLKRIIYVIPYTTIIEQTADVFREAFGKNHAHAVIEHHSNVNEEKLPEKAEDADDQEDLRTLAWENWDAPIIVTTAVQFFESFFAARSSRCRKLHNVAESVVILDEAQTLPIRFFNPCIALLKELTRQYKTSVVLCTATQPEVGVKPWSKVGLENVSEIISDPDELFDALKRVSIKHLGILDSQSLAERLKQHNQALCIVNTRAHARELCEILTKEGCAVYHLSTWMYPEHRRKKLKKIRELLDDPSNPPCIVISTSLIEAGVDISFPVVYRALNGLDSIHQAAGRCNREGKYPVGHVYIFETEQKLKGEQSRKISACQMALGEMDDLFSRRAISFYFDALHSMEGDDGRDKKQILANIAATAMDGYMPYRSVAHDFRFIDTDESTILVICEPEAQNDLEHLKAGELNRQLHRKLQKWCVSLPQRQWNELLRKGIIEPVGFSGQWHLLNKPNDLYNDDFGLDVRDPTFMSAESQVL